MRRTRRTILATADFRRVETLPRRKSEVTEEEINGLTEALKTAEGTMSLRPVQALALKEAFEAGGMFGSIGVGHGKTLISLLAPALLGAERPLLLLPAQLKRITITSVLPEMRKHWKIPANLRIESYHAISNNRDLLMDYQPDLIIADECHKISASGSARTRRILRYFDSNPSTKFIGLSGTITKKSLQDYWHLLIMAFGNDAPIPLRWNEMREWAGYLDDEDFEFTRPNPGALRKLCLETSPAELSEMSFDEERETIRNGFRDRLVQTSGVVATEESAVDCSLILGTRSIDPGDWIKNALVELNASWVTPDGEEVTDAVDLWRKTRELSMGFYYKWDWGEEGVNHEWLEARKEWRKYVRRTTARSVKYDTEFLVTMACERGDLNSQEYEYWKAIKGEANPKSVTVWGDDTVLNDAIELAEEKNTILWFEHRAVGERLSQLRPEWPTFSGGNSANNKLVAHVSEGKGPAVASIKAHGTGVNLQAYSDGIVLTPPSSGSNWEQLIGRNHRTGQQADEVTFTVYTHTEVMEASFEKAKQNAKYIEQSTGQKQKLNYAAVI